LSAPTIPGLTDLVEVGRGGFAIVYRAQQEAVGRPIAVKVLAALDLDSEQQRRFRLECRAMGALSSHPNIVQVFDAGTSAEGLPYIVMEFMPSGSLWSRVRTHGRLNVPDLFAVGISMAGAIETAHRAGILHRDIKPDNILLDAAGAYRLTDFGIAAVNDGTRSMTGSVSGTIGFLPPEVVRGERATEQSDIYEMGATLHALATGAVPFRRPTDENPVSSLARILSEEPGDLYPYGVPESLSSVIRSAMAKEPDARYRSAAQFGEALIDAQRLAGLPPLRMVVLGESAGDTIARMPSLPAPPLLIVPTSPSANLTVPSSDPTTVRQPPSSQPTLFDVGDRPKQSTGLRGGRLAAVIIGCISIGGVVIGGAAVALNSRSDSKRSGAATILVGTASISGTTTASPVAPVTIATATTAPATPSSPPQRTTAATTPPATTAAPVTTAARVTTVATTTKLAPPPEPLAVAVARSYATAVARHDWGAARTLNPGLPDDAALEKGYGYLNEQIVMDAVTAPTSNNLNDVRLLVLAHEAPPAGEQTSMWCFHWRFDSITHTIKSIDGKRLQTYPGTLEPASIPSDLSETCRALELK
jgi:serine/threonine protein kinase